MPSHLDSSRKSPGEAVDSRKKGTKSAPGLDELHVPHGAAPAEGGPKLVLRDSERDVPHIHGGTNPAHWGGGI